MKQDEGQNYPCEPEGRLGNKGPWSKNWPKGIQVFIAPAVFKKRPEGGDLEEPAAGNAVGQRHVEAPGNHVVLHMPERTRPPKGGLLIRPHGHPQAPETNMIPGKARDSLEEPTYSRRPQRLPRREGDATPQGEVEPESSHKGGLGLEVTRVCGCGVSRFMFWIFGEERAYTEQGCGLWALEWVRTR